MPALPSRPSATTARRCVASCTDRTPQRFCQAFTPAASANRGQLPRPPTALQRTLFAVVTRRVSAAGASASLPHSSAKVRSLSGLCEKLEHYPFKLRHSRRWRGSWRIPGGKLIEQFADVLPGLLDGARIGFAQQGVEL